MIKKKRNKIHTFERLAILLLVIGLSLIICLGRACNLVYKNGSEYYHKALSQATGSGTVIAARPGNIVDANGTLLASSKKVYRLILDPKVMAETEEKYPGSMDKTVSLMSEAFGIEATELAGCFRDNSKLSYVRFGGNTILSEEQVETWNTLVQNFQDEKTQWNKTHNEDKIRTRVAGVWFEEEYRREYPLDNVLSKVIGYTTEDTSQGILGLELYYNDTLHGTDGREYSYVDENGVIKSEVTAAADGLNVETSLDANVAEMLQDTIADFMENVGGKRVNILVTDPNDGRVIAMASDTDFSLNEPSRIADMFTEEELQNPASTFLLQEAFRGRMDQLESMSVEKQREALIQQVQSNYAVSGTFEPGSTGKSLTLAAGIEEKIIGTDDRFYCDGSILVDKYTIHCHQEALCGDLNPMEALGRSCNVAFVRMNERIGPDIFSKYQEIFNLGQKTGIDLPGEANTASLIYKSDGLHAIEMATNSFGQGYNVTMLQLAAAYASLVNGGYYYEPHVVTRITDSAGNVVSEHDPVLVRRTISEETSEYMKEALRYVTTKGTACLIAPKEGYTLAGKTGAAEKLPRGTGKYIVSFIGVVPVEAPKFLIYVAVDEPDVEDQSSSVPAQQLVHDCLDKLYSYFNIYPETEDDAYSYDWSKLRDSSGDSDSAGGESFIDDPDGSVNWIEDTASENESPSEE